MFKRDPNHSFHLMQSVKNMIHHAPIDRDAKELFTPLLQVPNLSQFINSSSQNNMMYSMDDYINTPQHKEC